MGAQSGPSSLATRRRAAILYTGVALLLSVLLFNQIERNGLAWGALVAAVAFTARAIASQRALPIGARLDDLLQQVAVLQSELSALRSRTLEVDRETTE